MRDYLVYVPCNRGKIAADLWGGPPSGGNGDERLYDVALNDYTGRGDYLTPAEHHFAHEGHKWPVISRMRPLCSQYESVCFLDDDVEIDMPGLNRLFEIGRARQLCLWQASLTADSRHSHGCHKTRPGSLVRCVPLVEIMMPVFVHEALLAVWQTFSESQSGYGLDLLWPKVLKNKGLAVVDCVQARHIGPVNSGSWRMPNGKMKAEG